MITPEVVVTRAGVTAVLTITNPAKRNAMTAAMWRDIPRHLATLATDATVRVVVLTGHGGTFCAGSDINDLDNLHHSALPGDAEEAIAAFAKPVIAAIAGHCMGGGCQLAAACDIRLAGEEAHFAVPPAKLGIVYPLSATQRLLWLIGPSATKYMIFTGERLNATRALHVGLVDEVVPTDLLADRALHLAKVIAGRSQLTIQATKEITTRLIQGHDAADLVDDWVREANASPDLAEGMASFAARREPHFTWTRPTPTR